MSFDYTGVFSTSSRCNATYSIDMNYSVRLWFKNGNLKKQVIYYKGEICDYQGIPAIQKFKENCFVYYMKHKTTKVKTPRTRRSKKSKPLHETEVVPVVEPSVLVPQPPIQRKRIPIDQLAIKLAFRPLGLFDFQTTRHITYGFN